MSRCPVLVTQADVARVIRAAKQADASEVVVKLGEQSVIVRESTNAANALERDEEIVLMMRQMSHPPPAPLPHLRHYARDAVRCDHFPYRRSCDLDTAHLLKPVPCQVGLCQLNKKLNFFILIPGASGNFTSHQTFGMIQCRMSTDTPIAIVTQRTCLRKLRTAAAYRDRTSALAAAFVAIRNENPRCNVVGSANAA